MSQRPIIDAGPGLNFLSINKERLLFGTLGPLSAPETVRDEVLRKAQQDKRFGAAETVWRKLPDRLMQILPDDQTPELAAVVHRLTGLPIDDRLKNSRDLGETMVIAHASSPPSEATPSPCSSMTGKGRASRQLRSIACGASEPVVGKSGRSG